LSCSFRLYLTKSLSYLMESASGLEYPGTAPRRLEGLMQPAAALPAGFTWIYFLIYIAESLSAPKSYIKGINIHTFGNDFLRLSGAIAYNKVINSSPIPSDVLSKPNRNNFEPCCSRREYRGCSRNNRNFAFVWEVRCDSCWQGG